MSHDTWQYPSPPLELGPQVHFLFWISAHVLLDFAVSVLLSKQLIRIFTTFSLLSLFSYFWFIFSMCCNLQISKVVSKRKRDEGSEGEDAGGIYCSPRIMAIFGQATRENDQICRGRVEAGYTILRNECQAIKLPFLKYFVNIWLWLLFLNYIFFHIYLPPMNYLRPDYMLHPS